MDFLKSIFGFFFGGNRETSAADNSGSGGGGFFDTIINFFKSIFQAIFGGGDDGSGQSQSSGASQGADQGGGGSGHSQGSGGTHRPGLLSRFGNWTSDTLHSAGNWISEKIHNAEDWMFGRSHSPNLPTNTTVIDAAFIGQESSGNPNAVSAVGAAGLMQIMPDTARGLLKELGMRSNYSDSQVTDLIKHNPTLNVALGHRYIQDLVQKYDGNVALAAAAYNAGDGAVDGWIKAYGDPRKGQISEKDWIAHIPYKETREYVPIIIANLGRLQGPAESEAGTRVASIEKPLTTPPVAKSGIDQLAEQFTRAHYSG
jgi:hypothetical protein